MCIRDRFYLQKTETKTVTTDNIEETKQNLTKLVQETYVKDEDQSKNKNSDEKTKVKCKFNKLGKSYCFF